MCFIGEMIQLGQMKEELTVGWRSETDGLEGLESYEYRKGQDEEDLAQQQPLLQLLHLKAPQVSAMDYQDTWTMVSSLYYSACNGVAFSTVFLWIHLTKVSPYSVN